MKIQYLFTLMLVLLFACENPVYKKAEGPLFSVINTLDVSREDVALKLTIKELSAEYPSINWEAVKFMSDEQNIPFQANDINGDGAIDNFTLILDFTAGEKKNVVIKPLSKKEGLPTFEKRTQAEISHKTNGEWKGREYIGGEFINVDYLRVPPEHTDHSWFLRYEGPGWESDLVGYRFYLDWRNATDIFGKKTTDMVLQGVGQDGFDSYHESADWGMDILKVGKSLGIGAIGTYFNNKALRVEKTDSITCNITENGVVESQVRTKYFGWKVGDVSTDLSSELTIQAGSRLTRHQVKLNQRLPNLCTGIVKHENGNLLTQENGSWGYIATWGKQSLADDHLGMAIIYNKSNLIEITEDEHNQLVVLTPSDNELTYYFLASWEQEPNGIQTGEAFRKYLNNVIIELGTPLIVEF